MTFQPFQVEVHFVFKIHLFEGLICMYRKGLALSYTDKFRAVRSFILPIHAACQTSPQVLHGPD